MLFEHGFSLYKYLNCALNCLHGVTQKSVAAWTDHFADAFVRENVARSYDVMLT